jgi:hypothetical protein
MLMLLLAVVKLAVIALILWRSGTISDWIVAPGELVVWLDVTQELCVDDWLDVVETAYEVDVEVDVDAVLEAEGLVCVEVVEVAEVVDVVLTLMVEDA